MAMAVSREWTIVIVLRRRVGRLHEIDPGRAGGVRSDKRDVVWITRRRAPILTGCNAGEGAKFAVEVRLVAVAVRQRQFRPRQRRAGRGMREQFAEALHAAEALGRQSG